ncbi:translation initiation factor eIF3 subunit [Russula ochroleuca]|jgi:translation initiation factor 3 subunit J|uniref:Eukaryotic translation initiation factor 3 subunit J n=1 Tax=Russula ochroleuca TaxID=152965 RepID=A0A9P5TD49_9AGAM|nr:translation initiation factor eIF3 subunit [Russula ochroleuca]
MSDWEGSGDDSPVRPIPNKALATKSSKWEGEDDDDDGPVSDWEASSDEEKEKPSPAAAAAAAAPHKKKGSLKQKLAEKEAERQARLALGDDQADYDEDAVLDPRAKANFEKQRELESDLRNATELFGPTDVVKGSSDADLDSILKSDPKSKEDFIALSDAIIAHVIKRHQDKPLYASFAEHHVRALAAPLRDVDVRKAASGLTTLANEKQREQREKLSGKKKPKAAGKPVLGASKLGNKLDTTVYDEALDDFGTNPDDFM